MREALSRTAYGIIGLALGSAVFCAAALFVTSAWPGGVDMWGVLVFCAVGLIVGAITGGVYSQAAWRLAHVQRSNSRPSWRAGLLLAGWILAAIALTVGMVWASSVIVQPPSDASLLANFSRHKAAFGQLAMICSNPQVYVRTGDSTTDQSLGNAVVIPGSLKAQFKRLIREIGARSEPWQGDLGEIDFSVWPADNNDSIPGIEKGYAYLAHPPAQLVKSLDNYQGSSTDPKDPDDIAWSGTGYRHIEGPWYIYYSYDTDKF